MGDIATFESFGMGVSVDFDSKVVGDMLWQPAPRRRTLQRKDSRMEKVVIFIGIWSEPHRSNGLREGTVVISLFHDLSMLATLCVSWGEKLNKKRTLKRRIQSRYTSQPWCPAWTEGKLFRFRRDYLSIQYYKIVTMSDYQRTLIQTFYRKCRIHAWHAWCALLCFPHLTRSASFRPS